MPISRNKLAVEERTVAVACEEETCAVTYNRRGITPRFLRELQAPDGGSLAEPTRQALQQLEHLVVRWEVLDEGGQPLPCTAEVMETLPIEFLGRVLAAIWDDFSPNSSRPGENSGSPSSPAESEDPSLTGIGSFG